MSGKRPGTRQWSDGAAGPLLKAVTGLSWMDRAACQDMGPGAFYPERGGSAKEAKLACQRCPVRERCHGYALESGQESGIWGGVIFEMGVPQETSPPVSEVCRNGHRRTDLNTTTLSTTGKIRCRDCDRDAGVRYRQSQKEAA